MSLSTDIEKADAAMRERMQAALGSPTEQHERLESLITALDPANATAIDRRWSPFWRSTK